MSKRLAMLEKLTSGGSTDSFAWYGLGMEYRSLGRMDEALGVFEKLCEMDPAYVATYLMAGQVLVKLGRPAEARTWLEKGVTAAGAKGDDHAQREISALLAEVVAELQGGDA